MLRGKWWEGQVAESKICERAVGRVKLLGPPTPPVLAPLLPLLLLALLLPPNCLTSTPCPTYHLPHYLPLLQWGKILYVEN